MNAGVVEGANRTFATITPNPKITRQIMVVAYKRLEEDIFFKNSEEMNQYIMDNADKNWYFLEKTKGHFVDEGENYTWCMTVVKPVEGFSMGV